MRGKWGDGIAGDFFGRGVRELGGFFYPGSNILQPQFGHRGGSVAPREPETPNRSMLDEHLQKAEANLEEHGRDDPERGIDRD